MAALASNVLTLLDWAKRLDPNGKVASIVELMDEINEIVSDMLWMPCNEKTSHRMTQRTGLPTLYFRSINETVPPSKSETAQIREVTSMLEGWSTIDADEAENSGDVNAYRESEAVSFVEAMGQKIATTIFYGNHGTSPKEFTGLAPRYSDSSAENWVNVIDGGGTSTGGSADNTSVWLVGWGGQANFGLFPDGSKAGIEHIDLGKYPLQGTTGAGAEQMMVYGEQWKAKPGLGQRDWRYAARLANLDVSNLASKLTAASVIEGMIKLIYRMPSLTTAKLGFYMNRTVMQALDLQRRDAMAYGMTWDTVDGKPVTSFRGIPVRRCDAILDSEEAVS